MVQIFNVKNDKSDKVSSLNLVWRIKLIVHVNEGHSLLWSGYDGVSGSLQVQVLEVQVLEEWHHWDIEFDLCSFGLLFRLLCDFSSSDVSFNSEVSSNDNWGKVGCWCGILR